jgi:hypothetical protein
MSYTYPSTMPECVRLETIRAWNNLWRRLRRMPENDRRCEIEFGTNFKVGNDVFKIRYAREKSGFYLRLPMPNECFELFVPGSSAFGSHKLYTYMDKLQVALDELSVRSVMNG